MQVEGDGSIAPQVTGRECLPDRQDREVGVTVSMRVMSAGDGYKYLLKTIAAADGDRPLSTPLTRY